MVPPGPTPEPASRGRGPLVLVVEDEFLLAMDLELLLEGHGFRVLGPAATVAEALRLLVAVARRASGVPFVLASAYDRPELAAAGLAGATKVGKPTSERRLLAALAQIVGR
jgi:CheY-like chemotaxis protein